MKSTTINARVSEQTEQEILFLKKELGLKHTTAVITLALHRMAIAQKQASSKSPFEMMEELGLIGGLNAPANLSTDYKQSIQAGLKKKHGIKKH